MNDSLIEEIKSIPGVIDVMTREIVSVNLNGTRFPATIVSKKDFDFMRHGSVPAISSSKQRSQSVTLYSCRCLVIQVSFNALDRKSVV